jgi:D-glucuronyl C5-epimerase C-terminus
LSYRRLLGCLASGVAALCALALPGLTRAANITILGRDGHVFVRNDPALPPEIPAPPPAYVGIPARAGGPEAGAAAGDVTSELSRLFHTHQIDRSAYMHYSGNFQDALDTFRRLTGTRAAELDAVIENLHGIAAAGLLTPSRLPALFLTLQVNEQWWSKGPLLSPGQRVGFPDSQIVWEYYPGQGIELQELGSWGQADWMDEAGPRYWKRLHELVDELIPLGARRGGGIAWEYYFSFDGGTPPWTSAMSQGTALQALTQAYETSGDLNYLDLARQSLPIFSDGPPVGVSVPTALGRRYLLYSFAPGAAVINGFLQTLIGLFDYAKVSGDTRAWRLFHEGDREARAELPHYDTGSWSLYQPGVLDTRDYHALVTQFLEQLCSRTHARIYCTTAARFERYLKHPPPGT